MTTDCDLDVMNNIKELGDDNNAFYVRSDSDDGFYYFTGSIEGIGEAIANLMEQDEVVRDIIVHAVKTFQE